MTGRWPRLYIPGQNVGCISGARLTHVGNAQGKVLTRRSEGKGKDRELSVSLLRDISGSRPENFKTKSICQRRQEKKSHEEFKKREEKLVKERELKNQSRSRRRGVEKLM